MIETWDVVPFFTKSELWSFALGWVYRLKECEQTNEIQGIIYEFHEIKW